MQMNEDMLNVTLYFVLDRRDDNPVSEDQWKDFIKNKVTPHFPKGLTVTSGRGQYLAASGTLYDEDSKILHIVYEREINSDEKIEELREWFCQEYDQESVMRVDNQSPASW